jgi:uncharacterized membrane protein YphA (DoxX/SURF4 family)
MKYVLWIVQLLLALLFLFAGGVKLVLPIEQMTQGTPIPGWFLRFIGVCEILGALGLVLPGLFRIALYLTPLAACGLIVIMIGAVIISALTGPPALAAIPFAVGLALCIVAYKRRASAAGG